MHHTNLADISYTVQKYLSKLTAEVAAHCYVDFQRPFCMISRISTNKLKWKFTDFQRPVDFYRECVYVKLRTSSSQKVEVLPRQRTGDCIDGLPEPRRSLLLNGVLEQFLQRLQQLYHIRRVRCNLRFIYSNNTTYLQSYIHYSVFSIVSSIINQHRRKMFFFFAKMHTSES